MTAWWVYEARCIFSQIVRCLGTVQSTSHRRRTLNVTVHAEHSGVHVGDSQRSRASLTALLRVPNYSSAQLHRALCHSAHVPFSRCIIRITTAKGTSRSPFTDLLSRRHRVSTNPNLSNNKAGTGTTGLPTAVVHVYLYILPRNGWVSGQLLSCGESSCYSVLGKDAKTPLATVRLISQESGASITPYLSHKGQRSMESVIIFVWPPFFFQNLFSPFPVFVFTSRLSLWDQLSPLDCRCQLCLTPMPVILPSVLFYFLYLHFPANFPKVYQGAGDEARPTNGSSWRWRYS